MIAQQYAWNIHYPGADGKFGETKVNLVDEQDNPIGLDRNSEFGKDDFYTINPKLHYFYGLFCDIVVKVLNFG